MQSYDEALQRGFVRFVQIFLDFRMVLMSFWEHLARKFLFLERSFCGFSMA